MINASEAAAALGRIKTAKKAASSARNGFQEKPLESYPCTCGGCPDAPKTTCPRGLTIRRRAKRKAQKA